MVEKHIDGIHQLTFEDLFGPEYGADKKKPEPISDHPDKKRPVVKKKSAASPRQKCQARDEAPLRTEKTDGCTGTKAETINTVKEKKKKNPVAKKSTDKRGSKNLKAPDTEKIVSSDAKEDTVGNKSETDEEKITFTRESPCPFIIGESVELKYGGKLFTVLDIMGNTVRLVQTEGECSECIVACSDLKHSDKPGRDIEG